MKFWIWENALWLLLNLFALTVMVSLLAQINSFIHFTVAFNAPFTAEPDIMMQSGKWAFRFLLVSLAMTPLNTLMGWRSGIKLRKPAGLWAFAFGALHFVLFVLERFPSTEWIALFTQHYILLGIISLLILASLAATSTRWAMKRLGKNWKRLHRLVYAAGILIAAHSLLATIWSKKLSILETNAVYELTIYTAILIVLLVMRIPFIRSTASNMNSRIRILRA